MYGPASSDRFARVCRCGAYYQGRHDGLRDAQGGTCQHFGVYVRLESREWLPGKLRTDVVAPATHPSGNTLSEDVTCGETVGAPGHAPRRLEAREASKDSKYARYYPPTWVMRGAACSPLGEVGPGMREVVGWLSAHCSRIASVPAGVVEADMWRAMGISLVRRLTYTYELAAVAQWGDGPTPGWVPRVRAVIDGELGPFDMGACAECD